MKLILKRRYIILAIWLVAVVLFALNQPNLKQVLNEKGEATFNADLPSQVAKEMINKMGTAKGDTLLLVFNEEEALTEVQLADIETNVALLREKSEELLITNITDPFSTPEAKAQMISKDGTTVLISVNYERGTRDSETIINSFHDAIKDSSVHYYITGELAIQKDYLESSNAGVSKSAIITVIFILIVLILMFRSVVTPLVSLCAVAVAYITSMSVIGFLINTMNFPITALTQMFIILILFGIGTDYNILLFNRFKEELGHGLSVDDAIIKTYQSAGKTVIYSGLTVFIAFASLSFVQFSIYRSANAVAIGIAALLLEMLTLTPVLMRLLAGKLFWPSHHASGHKESKLWSGITLSSVKHPYISLVVVALILVPVIWFNSTSLSFDSLKDLSADTPSVKGFNIVSDKFGVGNVMPTTVIFEGTEVLNTNESLQVIDRITEKLSALDGIALVSGPTRPLGAPIEDFYTDSQTELVADGLSQANDGALAIQGGLTTISANLTTPDFSKVSELAGGTAQLINGMSAVTDGLSQVQSGIDQGAGGATQIAGGITGLKLGVEKIHTGLETISTNLNQINSGYAQLQSGYTALPPSIDQLQLLVGAMSSTVTKLVENYPEDTDILTLQGQFAGLSQALDGLSTGIKTANTNYATLTQGLNALNDGLKLLVTQTASDSVLVQGILSLETGAAALADGLNQGSAGQGKIIDSMSQLQSGAEQIKSGQDTLSEGLSTLSGGMTQLKDGIDQSSDGILSISDGLTKANDFLAELTTTKSFYIPEAAFATDEINQMFNAYMSTDRTLAKLTINLTTNPYADESMLVIDEINKIIENELKGTSMADAKFGIAGPTANTYDLNNVATHDITFTQIIVLLSIFILLLLIIRSFWIPVYIIGCLVVAYYAAISVTAFLTAKLFDGMAMSWNVPFFSFVVIAALGVDYSIFLMTRFKEYPELSPKEAIVMASRHVGGVVMSAAIILSGTFATLYPSNLHILMELAICGVTGLMLLSLVLLPVVIPALISITEKVSSKVHHQK